MKTIKVNGTYVEDRIQTRLWTGATNIFGRNIFSVRRKGWAKRARSID